MFAYVKKSPERLQVVDRVTEWARERFKLPKEAREATSTAAEGGWPPA